MKKITFTLDEKSIGEAIKEVKAYRTRILERTKELQRRVAEDIKFEAEWGFGVGMVDDVLIGYNGKPDVKVSIQTNGNISLVIAKGEDAIWMEFGSGIYHNTPVGSSPHPKGKEFGFTIGGYGQGKGARKVWGYYKDKELKLTHGTPAQMPMYNAAKIIGEKIYEIAKNVFSEEGQA